MRLFGLAALTLTVVVLAVTSAAGAFGGNSYPRKGAAPSPSPAELRKLGRLALRTATLAGDPYPTGAVVVPTTRQVAERVDADAVVNSNPPAYFVLVNGNFTFHGPVPAGAKEPTGTILTMTINSQTNQGLDGGVQDQMPDLHAIGQPEPLPLPPTVK
jgi:hypothetical protein